MIGVRLEYAGVWWVGWHGDGVQLVGFGLAWEMVGAGHCSQLTIQLKMRRRIMKMIA